MRRAASGRTACSTQRGCAPRPGAAVPARGRAAAPTRRQERCPGARQRRTGPPSAAALAHPRPPEARATNTCMGCQCAERAAQHALEAGGACPRRGPLRHALPVRRCGARSDCARAPQAVASPVAGLTRVAARTALARTTRQLWHPSVPTTQHAGRGYRRPPPRISVSCVRANRATATRRSSESGGRRGV